MSILVILEHDNKDLKKSSLSTISAALEISEKTNGANIDLFVAGNGCDAVIQKASTISKINKVISSEGTVFEGFLPEVMCEALKSIAGDYDYILAPASTFGKNILPRLSALLDVQQISDVVEIVDENTFSHPVYAGNIIATVKTSDAKKLLTIRDTAFDCFEEFGASTSVEKLEEVSNPLDSKFVEKQSSTSARPDLTVANIIVSGGKGTQNKEGFEIIGKLADKLGAAVGATRAVVDEGIVSNDLQVGQTGKIVAPNLYIAAGVSGAIQHIAGMRDSKIVIAINKDEEAPIFAYSDYGIVGDLAKIIPEVLEKI